VLAALAVSFLQQVLAHRYGLGYARLDLIALFGAFIAISAPASAALWSGLFLGVLRDMSSIGRLGTSALSIIPAVLLVAALKERLYRRSFILDIAFAFLFMLCFGAVYATGMVIFSTGVTYRFFYYAVVQSAYTAILVPPFFGLFRLAGIVEHQKTTF